MASIRRRTTPAGAFLGTRPLKVQHYGVYLTLAKSTVPSGRGSIMPEVVDLFFADPSSAVSPKRLQALVAYSLGFEISSTLFNPTVRANDPCGSGREGYKLFFNITIT